MAKFLFIEDDKSILQSAQLVLGILFPDDVFFSPQVTPKLLRLSLRLRTMTHHLMVA